MICFVILYVSYVVYDIWSYCFKVNDDVKMDVGIVLGVVLWNGKLFFVFKERINYVIFLYKNGNIKKIIFIGGIKFEVEFEEVCIVRVYVMK